MTVRNLDHLFRPRTVALVGASPRPGSLGAVLARNLTEGGFAGPVMMVNPRHASVAGRPCYRDISALPHPPDLAVIATPPQTVPGIIAELATRGGRAAVVITAGFAEAGHADGHALQQAMLRVAKPHLLRIVGPNCLGILHPSIGLNASFAHLQPRPGPLAFIAQSGAVITSVLDWAAPRGIGFSHLVSMGDMADVDFGDMLDYLVQDVETRAILLYVEMITSPRKFMSAARAAARSKPVIVVKAGRHAEGARAAASHTGALAGADLVYDAAFRRAGMLRVFELADLFTAVETLSHGLSIGSDRLAIVTNGGGMGVLATDRLIDEGGRLAELSAGTIARLNGILPPTWSHGNPIDIIGDADSVRYGAALEAALDDAGADAVLVLNCPTAVASSSKAARAVAASAQAHRGRAIFTSWVGEAAVAEGRAMLSANGIPTYETPEAAVRAFMQLATYRRNQRALLEAPSNLATAVEPDRAGVKALIGAALVSRCEWLPLPDALAAMAAYGIPVVPTQRTVTAELAGRQAEGLTPPYALKAISPDIVHKSDAGAVVLDLPTPQAVLEAARSMSAHLAISHPGARLDGFAVQSMIRRSHAQELLLGATDDRQFGPVILFGQGGTATEIIADRAVALPPLNRALAQDLMGRTRIDRLLQGYRDRPAVALNAVADALVQLSQLVIDHPEITEVDINPLLADEHGVIALDGRIRVARTDRLGTSRLAIQPYPRELESTLALRDGRTARLRPVRPEDAAALLDILGSPGPNDVYARYFSALSAVPQEFAARLSQIDYDREMTFVIFHPDSTVPASGSAPEAERIVGAIHLVMAPDRDTAEFALIVAQDMRGQGLGYLLMRRMIDYAQRQGVKQIDGQVKQADSTMLTMSRELGFAMARDRAENGLVRVTRRFGSAG